MKGEGKKRLTAQRKLELYLETRQKDANLGEILRRYGVQSESQGTEKSDGPESHNGLLYCYERTNITGERVVNPHRTQLESWISNVFPSRSWK